VEERDGARGMTQRRFDLAPEPQDPSKEVTAPPPEPVPSGAPPLPIPREPSDLALRERQMRWVRARLRFEAERKSPDLPEGPK
jgi:hypothetical protein